MSTFDWQRDQKAGSARAERGSRERGFRGRGGRRGGGRLVNPLPPALSSHPGPPPHPGPVRPRSRSGTGTRTLRVTRSITSPSVAAESYEEEEGGVTFSSSFSPLRHMEEAGEGNPPPWRRAGTASPALEQLVLAYAHLSPDHNGARA